MRRDLNVQVFSNLLNRS